MRIFIVPIKVRIWIDLFIAPNLDFSSPRLSKLALNSSVTNPKAPVISGTI